MNLLNNESMIILSVKKSWVGLGQPSISKCNIYKNKVLLCIRGNMKSIVYYELLNRIIA